MAVYLLRQEEAVLCSTCVNTSKHHFECKLITNESLDVFEYAAVQINKAVRQSPDLLFIATSFWFEESPSAVRTNKAGLGRLCTLFVCSTLLVFEHTHAVLSSTLVLCCTMVTTSTAAMSNSRYADTDRMKNVFLIRFSKAHLDRTKAGRMPADWKALPLHLSIRTPTCVH